MASTRSDKDVVQSGFGSLTDRDREIILFNHTQDDNKGGKKNPSVYEKTVEQFQAMGVDKYRSTPTSRCPYHRHAPEPRARDHLISGGVAHE